MGGKAKGLLHAPGGVTIVERWKELLGELGVPVVLVGDASAYEGLGMEGLQDEPPGVGPLGGLVALLRHAGERGALAFACDMPFVSRGLVERLVAHVDAPVVAPRREGRWEPLCARYAAGVLPAAVARAASPHHSLQRLLDENGAVELPLTPEEVGQLRDWDSPEDMWSPRPPHDPQR
jgi:molybdopterin-guanine dinucleotide biosynthesis protein A